MNVSNLSQTAGLARARRSYLQNQQPAKRPTVTSAPLRPQTEPVDRGADVLSAMWLGFVIGVAFAAAVVALVGMVAS